MLVPIRMGINMAAGNQQKHLSLSLLQKREFISQGAQKHQSNTFSDTRNVQIATFPEISPEISHFFNQLGSHANAASRKSLKIQA